jgi:hypothetical protein
VHLVGFHYKNLQFCTTFLTFPVNVSKRHSISDRHNTTAWNYMLLSDIVREVTGCDVLYNKPYRYRQWLACHRPSRRTCLPDWTRCAVRTVTVPRLRVVLCSAGHNKIQCPYRDKRVWKLKVKSSLFWHVTQHRLVVRYRHFGTDRLYRNVGTNYQSRHRFFLVSLAPKANAEVVPNFPSATTCFSCSPPDLNLVVTNVIFCIQVK